MGGLIVTTGILTTDIIYRGEVVDAPFSRVETGRHTVVDAPFAHVYSGRLGHHIVAPFVDLWVPH